jgi:UDP-N-acetylglucosamine--N-acetylmuramyl-(pentapeptide) pyrophosphoryl-undecaprenol N-acetylglucosamine transferase
MRRVLIAGGGTGGHIYPGLAIAEELITRSPRPEVIFVGTPNGMEMRLVPRFGFPVVGICSGGVIGKGILSRLSSLCVRAPIGLLQALSLLVRLKPDVVIGVGGYASGPLALAAILSGVPTLLQEQNLLPGVTNRILAPWVEAIAVTFEQSRRSLSGQVVVTGNPLRRAVLKGVQRTPDDRFHLLVLGGSRGARALNRLMLEAIPYLKSLYHRLSIIHQTGEVDAAETKHAYARDAGDRLEWRVAPFLERVWEEYGWADLVVCRAGATTVAEITACGKAAIFVPFPHAARNHQVYNARYLADRGAAVVREQGELTAERLAGTILELAQDEPRRARMAARSHALGSPNAAARVADLAARLSRSS